MAGKSKKFITKKSTAVKKHKVVHKQIESPLYNPTIQNQPSPQAPFPSVYQPTIQAYPQPQPIQPQPSQVTPQPAIIPSPVLREKKPTIDNLATQSPSLDTKSESMLQQPVQPIVTTNAPINIPSSNQMNSLPSQENEPEKKSGLWIIIVVVIILVVFIAGALYYFRTKEVKQITKEDKVEPSRTIPSVAPTVSQATESADLIDYSKYKIRVLNGSGTTGEASKVKSLLEEEKFIVKDIDNAESSDYEKTIIRAKKDVPKEYLNKLNKLLGKTYVLDTEEELRESTDVDVIIIIGKSQKP